MGKLTYNINTLLVKDMTVGEVSVLASKIRAAGGSRNAGVDIDLGLAAMYVSNDLARYRFDSRGAKLRVEDFYMLRKMACEDFIQIHRLNYVTYNVVQEIADELSDKGLMKFAAKKYWRLAESTYNEYLTAHKSKIDRASWSTVQDHGRLVYNTIEPHIESLSNAVRDYLIQKRQQITACGQKDDISMLTEIYVALMFCAALRNTRTNFIANIYRQRGIDFSCDASYADIDGVCRNFVWMMQNFGFKFVKDKEGDSVPAGVDISQSVRVESEWNKIVDIVTDEELMDKTALDAISMNPEVKASYDARMEKIERKELEDALLALDGKFNVKRS